MNIHHFLSLTIIYYLVLHQFYSDDLSHQKLFYVIELLVLLIIYLLVFDYLLPNFFHRPLLSESLIEGETKKGRTQTLSVESYPRGGEVSSVLFKSKQYCKGDEDGCEDNVDPYYNHVCCVLLLLSVRT